MLFLLIPPFVFLAAWLWLAWSSRTRRAPEIGATIEAHERFRAALQRDVTDRRVIVHASGHGERREHAEAS